MKRLIRLAVFLFAVYYAFQLGLTCRKADEIKNRLSEQIPKIEEIRDYASEKIAVFKDVIADYLPEFISST